jgi:hypothetical protein
VRFYNKTDKILWDAYVTNHPSSTCYHLSGWKRIIEDTYGHKAYYLLTETLDGSATQQANQEIDRPSYLIVGILPLIHIKHRLFGNVLVSLPFCDYGGILADNDGIAAILLEEAQKIAHTLQVDYIEFRHISPIAYLINI